MLSIDQDVVDAHLKTIKEMEYIAEQLPISFNCFWKQQEGLSNTKETFILYLKASKEITQVNEDKYGVVFQLYLNLKYYSIIVLSKHDTVVIKYGHNVRDVDIVFN